MSELSGDVGRWDFLKLIAAAGATSIAGHSILSELARAQNTRPAHPAAVVENYFRTILDGFVKNAVATSTDRSFAVCDYPGGTKLKSCCTPSGKTYVSVARMLPLLAEAPDPGLRNAAMSVFHHAFDPQHPDFWGYAPPGKATQLSVEAALVAWALWHLRKEELDALTPPQRTNIQKWLASCTQVPERTTNHSWFSAINQAVRLQL